jgi:hypothetical protein
LAAITDLPQYKSLIQAPHKGAQKLWFKQREATSTAQMMVSTWLFTPNAGATPSTAAALDYSTTGALDPTLDTALTMWLAQLEFGMLAASSASLPSQHLIPILFDRLSHQGGLSGTVTTAQTTNLPTAALTRYTNGEGVMPFLEIYSAVGSTATTVTATYTNTGGVDHTTLATPFGASTALNAIHRLIPLPLAQGDTGCRAVKDVTLAASTLTAGNFGVTLMKPLAMFPSIDSSNQTQWWDAIFDGAGNLPIIQNHACLMFGLFGLGNAALFSQPGSSVYATATVVEH